MIVRMWQGRVASPATARFLLEFEPRVVPYGVVGRA